MNFQTIPIPDFLTQLEGFFAQHGNITISNLLPSTLFDAYAQLKGWECMDAPIEGWFAFEQCLEDWDAEKFREVMKMEELAQNQPCYLVTDEGYRQNIVFEFTPTAFQTFADRYESHFRMSFFQSADYIVFSGDFTQVRIIHHNGVLWCIDPLSQ